MSVVNGFNRAEGTVAIALRRCATNVVTALTLLFRPARVNAPLLPSAPRAVAMATAIVVAVFVLSMLTFDAAAIRGARHLPRWIASVFDEITDFGKSGWFLWPLGLLFLALAALPATLTPFSQRVFAAIMVRIGFLFTAIAVPGLFVTIVKRLIRLCSFHSKGTPPMRGPHPVTSLRHLRCWWLSALSGRAPARHC